ncbi:MAG TPA: helix-turn-helix domain-containing protein [Nocardioides sp.]|nr:helix-turn-helix domain-containing protein [Nocardioides sp.]
MSDPAAGPAFRRLEPDERRTQILRSAVQLFGERPYATVSTTELAGAAGVTRGLLHHYFGTKRELYLEVVRTMMFAPDEDDTFAPTGTIHERAGTVVDGLLDLLDRAGPTWVRASGAEGFGSDPEVQEILDRADDAATERTLAAVGFEGTTEQRALAHVAVRAYGAMVKAVGRELIERRSMSRPDARRLLTDALVATLESVAPQRDG